MNNIYLLSRNNVSPNNATLSHEETLFHSANGYIGVRGALEEGYPKSFSSVRGSYINGVYNNIPMPQAEALYGLATEKQTIVNVADVQDIKVYLDGELCSPFSGTCVKNERTLDMRNGYVKREFVWKNSKSKKISIEFSRLTSFIRLPLFVISCKITADNLDSVRIQASHKTDVFNFFDPNDPRVASESVKHVITDDVKCEKRKDGVSSTISSHISNSDISVVTNVFDEVKIVNSGLEDVDTNMANVYDMDIKTTCSNESVLSEYSFNFSNSSGGSSLSGDSSLTGSDGLHDNNNLNGASNLSSATNVSSVEFTRFVTFTDSRRYKDPVSSGKKILDSAVKDGLSVIFTEQKKYLDSFWKNTEFEINGDADLSSALTFNIYQLLQSVGKDKYSHLGAKGLSGEGYEGHYFWDTEMYVQPVFTLTNPEISKQLLEFRHACLKSARSNAVLMGHKKGVLFPWRTISGKECSGFFPSGTAQYHINGAIAYAVIMYYLVTGDTDFIIDKGLELLIEISRLWIDVGTYSNGKFLIHCVTGPDEYTCIVNNNYYTNCCAKYDLYWTWKLFKDLNSKQLLDKLITKTSVTEDEVNEFIKASESMFLPYSEELDITPQDDSFLSKKVWDIKSTPKSKFPLLLHYHPLTIYRYQVCKQADAVLAHFLYEDYAKFSTIKNSFNYYEKITTHDSTLSECIFSIVASKINMVEKAYSYFRDSVEIDLKNSHNNTKDGIHTANMGGSFLALIFGFAGFRVKESGFFFSPIIPEKWESYSFSLKLHNQKLHISVSHSDVILSLDIEGKDKDKDKDNELDKLEELEVNLYEEKLLLKGGESVKKSLHI